MGKTATLTAQLGPDHATNKTVTWTSSDPATVSVGAPTLEDDVSSVVVTAHKVGSATITATSADNANVVATCAVTVPEVKVTGLSMESDATLYLNIPDGSSFIGSTTLTLDIEPFDTTNDIVWSCSTGDIVTLGTPSYTVDEETETKTGTITVTAKNKGTTVVTATADGKTAGCTVEVIQLATGVTLNKATLSLPKDSSETLVAVVAPATANNKTVEWASDNEEVATVDENGKVTAVATGGTATITATAADGSGQKATCVVTAQPIAVTGFLTTPQDVTIEKGDTATLTATVAPATAANQTVTWESADTNIATVSAGGVVTAKNGGSTTVTAKTADGGFTADCTVTVTVALTGMTLETNTLTIRRADGTANTGTLTATVTPADTTAGKVHWASGDTSIVTVAGESTEINKTTGKSSVTLNAVKAGTTTVTATIGNISQACTVTVTQAAGNITIPTELALSLHHATEPSGGTLTATLTPDDATDGVAWRSSDTAVATVSGSGKTATVTAISEGTANIIAACNGEEATCAVTVTDYEAKSFVTSPQNTTVKVGKTATLTAQLGPDHATNKTVTWASSDPDTVSVGAPALTGGVSSVVVTAHKVGSATITATSADNANVVATCTVTVPEDKVTGLSMESDATLYLNIPDGSSFTDSATLHLSISPFDTTNDIVWSSSNTGVVTLGQPSYTIDEQARTKTGTITITARDAGKAVVTATADGKTAQCTVTVKRLATDVTLDNTALALEKGGTATLKATVEPNTVSDASVKWTTSDATIATVNGGVVTAAGVGSATITATVQDGSGKQATCAVTVSAISVKGVSVTPKRLTMRVGDDPVTLSATITPSDAANKNVTWVSSNTNAATVDSSGKVTAVAVGEATITVKTEDGDKTDVCYVSVVPTPVSNLALSPTSIDVYFRDAAKRTQTLIATITPDTATDKSVTWASSNESVATVVGDSNGAATVTLHQAGSAVITARSSSNGSVYASCSVIVRATKVADISLNETFLSLEPGDRETLTATLRSDTDGVAPDNQTVTWSSSDPNVATVDNSGTVVAVGAGTAAITVLTEDQGKTATCVVRVWKKVTGVSLDQTTLGLNVGESTSLTATAAPGGAANRNVSWSSSANAVATVDAAGRVTAVSAGTATITVTTEDQGKTATCAVTVSTVPVSGVTLDKSALTLLVGDTRTLTAVVAPDTATNKTVSWTSGDSDIVSVANGVITALAPGEATITATAGSKSDTCTVKVYAAATGVTISDSAGPIQLNVGGSKALSATVTPDGANQAVNWNSSNTGVATVSADGVVTAVSPGSAVITASSVADATKQASCSFTVVQPATDLDLPQTSLDFDLSTATKTAVLSATITPGDSTDPVIWSISDTGVAQLSAASMENGVSTVTVYALKAGSATISVVCGEQSGRCTVSVTNPATGVLLDNGTLTLTRGDTKQLLATVLPADAQDNVGWSSSDTAVATVTDGLVRAVAKGTATITATANGHSATCSVTVEPVLVSSLTMASDPISLAENDNRQLSASVNSDATDKGIVWHSSNDTVATVSAAGLVTAVSAGTATITATAHGNDSFFKTCSVTVTAAVSGITLRDTLTLESGTTATLVPTILPANATNKAVTWSGGAAGIATVDENGVVTAVGPGTTTVTVTSHADDTKSASCTVTVTKAVDGVSIADAATPLTLNMGSTATLTATVSPNNATNKTVTWSSTDESVATVSGGIVTPVGPGTTAIIVTTEDGGFIASRTVNVAQLATGVTVTPSTVSLAVGRTAVLTAALAGNPTNSGINWSVDAGSSAVSVSENGVVTALAAGSATVRATAADGSGKSGVCVVQVFEPVTAVTIKKDGSAVAHVTLNLVTDPAAQLTAETTGGTNPVINWASDNSAVSVDQNGRVTAVSAGTATITVTATTGDVSVSKTCTVTVEKATLSVDQSYLLLRPGNLNGTVTFTNCRSDDTVTLTGNDAEVLRMTSSFGNAEKSFRFEARKNGVVTLDWTRAENDYYYADSGSITVVSLLDPITNVSFANLGTGNSLIADVSGDTIRVSGYVSTSPASDYSLDGKFSFALATDILGDLTASYSGSTVTVRSGGTEIRTYTVDRSGIVSLPESLTVDAASAVIADNGAVAAGTIQLTDSTVSGLNEAALAEVDCTGATSYTTSLSIEPTAQTLGSAQALTLDITPTYTVVKDGETINGTLSTVSTAVTIEIKVQFQPKLIVHNHNGTLEYPAFSCTGPADGYYTVSWRQSSFSEVRLLSEKRSGTIAFTHDNGSVETLLYDETDLGITLPTDSRAGAAFNGWTIGGATATKLTDAVLDAIHETTARATPSFTANSSDPVVPPDQPTAPTRPTPSYDDSSSSDDEPVPVKPAVTKPAETKPVVTSPVAGTAKSFNDVAPNHWAAEAIAYVSARGIINGQSAHIFAPESTTSRAMIAQILYNFDPEKAAGTQQFPDVSGVWFANAASWAASLGVVNGVDGKFRGDDAVTREQLATMLYRYAQLRGWAAGAVNASLDRFNDVSRVSSWAGDAMRWAVSAGLINGIGDTLSPGTGATRAQVAAIMMRFCENIVR